MRQEKCTFRCILNLDVQTGSGSDQILKTGSDQILKTGSEHFLNLDPISYKKKSAPTTASGSATLDTLKYVYTRFFAGHAPNEMQNVICLVVYTESLMLCMTGA